MKPRLREAAGWGALSLALHAIVLIVLLAIFKPFMVAPRDTTAPQGPEVGPLVYLTPAPGAPSRGERAEPEEGRVVAPTPPPAEPAVEGVERPGPLAVDSATPERPTFAVPARRRLGPAYGDGRLWVPPIDVVALGRVLPTAPGGGGGGVTPGPRALDSIVTRRLMAFLDTMPPDSFALPEAPKWTTEINGKTWGIDGRWIYLGDLKLPAALLALLPIPEGGYNYDQARAARDLQRMREDIMQAAQRAATTEEFNRYVKELRERKDREREEKRRVRRDTIIP